MQLSSLGSPMGMTELKSAQTRVQDNSVQKFQQAAEASKNPQDDKKLRDTCKEMEAVFLNILMSEMRKTVPKSSLTENSSGEEIMKSMLDSELTKNMSQAGGIGLADMMYRQLSLSQAAVKKVSQAPK